LHRLAVLVLFTFPGVPGIYYGDEIGMLDLPDLAGRGCLVWAQNAWDQSLLAYHKDLIALRRSSVVLQRGGFQVLAVETDLLAYQRDSTQDRILVILQRNPAARPASPLPIAQAGVMDGARFVEYFSGVKADVARGALFLPELPQGESLWQEIR